MRRFQLACGVLALSLLSARPALADGGMSAALAVAKYTFKFLSSASSNASAQVYATAVSTVGVDNKEDHDTGFFSATADITATSGDLAQQRSYGYARYHFLDPNEEVVSYKPVTLRGPQGISTDASAKTHVKGVLQVLVETLSRPTVGLSQVDSGVGDFTAPIHLSFDLDGLSSYSFDVSIEGEDGSVLDLATGSAGKNGKSISLPLLRMTDPVLAAQIEQQYLNAVSGRGSVSFYLGQGLLPNGADGNPGLPVSYALGSAFSLNSELDADHAQAIPEPRAWAMLLLGVALTGAVLRRRKSPLTATWRSAIPRSSSRGPVQI